MGIHPDDLKKMDQVSSLIKELFPEGLPDDDVSGEALRVIVCARLLGQSAAELLIHEDLGMEHLPLILERTTTSIVQAGFDTFNAGNAEEEG